LRRSHSSHFSGNRHKFGKRGHKTERFSHRALKLTQEDDEYGPVDEVVYPVEVNTAFEGEGEEENVMNIVTGPSVDPLPPFHTRLMGLFRSLSTL